MRVNRIFLGLSFFFLALGPVLAQGAGGSGGAPEGQTANAKTGAAPEGQSANPKTGTAPEGQTAIPKTGAAPEGQTANPKTVTAPEGQTANPKTAAATEGQSANPKTAAATEGQSANPKTAVATKGQTASPKTAAVSEGQSANGKTGAAPEGQSANGKTGTATKGQTANGKTGAVPEGQSANGKTATAPEGQTANPKTGVVPEGQTATSPARITPPATQKNLDLIELEPKPKEKAEVSSDEIQSPKNEAKIDLVAPDMPNFPDPGPVLPSANFTQGEKLFRQSKVEEAIPVLEKAILDKGVDERAWIYLALAYQSKGRLEDAQKTLLAGLPFSRDRISLFYYNLGNIRATQKELAAAEGLYTEALKINAQYAAAYLNRANVRVQLDKKVDARADYENYLKYSKDSQQKDAITKMIALLPKEAPAQTQVPTAASPTIKEGATGAAPASSVPATQAP